MKQYINHRHISLVSALLVPYLAIACWEVVAKFIQAIFSVTMSLLVRGIVAYIVNLLLRQYEYLYSHLFRRPSLQKFKQPVGIIMSYLTILLIITIVFALIIPELITYIKLLIANHSRIINHFIDYFGHSNDFEGFIDSLDTGRIQWDKIDKYLTSGVGGTFRAVISTASSVFSVVTTTIIAFFFSIYLLIYKEVLQCQFTKLLSTYFSRYQTQITGVLEVFDKNYSNYIVGQCKDATALGVSYFTGIVVLRMPYASMIGVVVAFGVLIPIIGAILGVGVGVIIIFAVSPLQAGTFLIFIILLQQLDNRITYPLVVGRSIDLPSVWVFTAVIINGGTSGILGVMFIVPLFTALYRLLSVDARNRITVQKDK